MVWGPGGAAVLVSQPAPGVVYVIGVRNFDGPFEDGPMCDFDRVIDAYGSIDLFMDMRIVERGSRKSREPWKEWTRRNRSRHRAYILVRSSLLHMAISVIAMASGSDTRCYSSEALFLADLAKKAPGIRALPTIPVWASAILETQRGARAEA
jgi:hypothetical protein